MRPSDFPTRMAWPNGFTAKRPSSGALGGGEVVNTGIVTGSLLSCFLVLLPLIFLLMLLHLMLVVGGM